MARLAASVVLLRNVLAMLSVDSPQLCHRGEAMPEREIRGHIVANDPLGSNAPYSCFIMETPDAVS